MEPTIIQQTLMNRRRSFWRNAQEYSQPFCPATCPTPSHESSGNTGEVTHRIIMARRNSFFVIVGVAGSLPICILRSAKSWKLIPVPNCFITARSILIDWTRNRTPDISPRVFAVRTVPAGSRKSANALDNVSDGDRSPYLQREEKRNGWCSRGRET